ncbi:MAG: mannosyltransferase family protein, partial [Solirubrobacteraceae bacterium]
MKTSTAELSEPNTSGDRRASGQPAKDAALAPERSRPGIGLLGGWGAGAPGRRDAEFQAATEASDTEAREARRDAWRAVWRSRALVWVAGVASVAALGYGPGRKVLQHGALTHGSGWLGDLLVAPSARWDAAWYLLIAHAGYGPSLGSATAARSAFYPLYPLAIRALSLGGYMAAGIVVSLLALGAALYLLHRLTALEVRAGSLRAANPAAPREVARAAVTVLAFSPMAFFLSAIYSESLYLALSLGVFWFARRGRWAWV